MPHLRLDVTSNIAEVGHLPAILERLVAKLCEFETVTPAAVKAYAQVKTVWTMGEGARPGFIHLELAVLTGRSPELLNSMSDAFYALLKELFEESVQADLAKITFELREMTSEYYRK